MRQSDSLYNQKETAHTVASRIQQGRERAGIACYGDCTEQPRTDGGSWAAGGSSCSRSPSSCFRPPFSGYKNSLLMNDSMSSRQMGHSPPPPLPPPEARSARVQARHSTLQGGERRDRGVGQAGMLI